MSEVKLEPGWLRATFERCRPQFERMVEAHERSARWHIRGIAINKARELYPSLVGAMSDEEIVDWVASRSPTPTEE